MGEVTTISVEVEHRESLDVAAESLFGTVDVPVKTTLERVLATHPDIDCEF